MFDWRPLPGLFGDTTIEKPHIAIFCITSHPAANCGVSQTVERRTGLVIIRLKDLRVETAAVA